MFAASALTLLSGAALANAALAGLRTAQASQDGSAEGDLTIKQLGDDYVVGAAQAEEVTLSAIVEDGQLQMLCPHEGLRGALVPLGDPGVYTLEFVAEVDGLPEGSVADGWMVSEDRAGLTNEALTKVVNKIDSGKGAFDIERDHTSGVSAIVYVNHNETGTPVPSPIYLVLDNTKDVQC
ncbi:hypothetical protein HDZ31DRAFT_60885 [Schizophyllum fasciatum]